jgi:endonuclease/exonuclease/phosphatase family metal-dependent hydrolase
MKRWLRRFAKFVGLLCLLVGALMAWNLRPPAVGEPDNFALRTGTTVPAAIRLRVVTWNVWGLLWMTPRREERLDILAREAAALKPDIIGFQEAFVEEDRAKLIAALRDVGLEHSRYFPSGLVGSGLLLVSRFSIESDGFIRYANNGYWYAPPHRQGDWWAGKGLSLSVVRLPDGTPLYVGNTHLHARYGGNQYHGTQLAQAGQLLPWARRVQATGWPALWMGDWNNTPQSDVLAPLAEAGEWRLLTTEQPRIDHIFGSGTGWKWQVIAQGKKNRFLEGEPKVPCSDHAACWLDVQLLR